jgi:nucleotide-binding universal stress UspA family protein
MRLFKIEKILVPIDFSETSMLAIEHAAFTAQLFKAELVLLHVIEKHFEKFNIVVPELRVESPSGMTNAVEKRLEDIAKNIRSKYGVQSTCTTTDGNIFTEVIAISKEHKTDLVIMGTHGTSGFVEFFAGSNTFKVASQSECPVISIQSHAQKLGFKEIILPIDLSAHSRQKVHHAIVMAKHFASIIHLVGLEDSNDELELKKLHQQMDQIEAVIAKNNLTSIKKFLPANNQAKMTMNYATEVNADLIIIMTDQDENLSGRLLGSYAQQIVNHSKIPVMSIQPNFGNADWGH